MEKYFEQKLNADRISRRAAVSAGSRHGSGCSGGAWWRLAMEVRRRSERSSCGERGRLQWQTVEQLLKEALKHMSL